MNYDWPYIRAQYETGQTAYAISKLGGGKPSKQAIANRAKSEGWVKPEQGKTVLPIVADALAIDSKKLTDELLHVVLGLIAEGAPIGLACSAAGIAETTWHDWCRKDPTLRDVTNRARAGKVINWVGAVDRATDKDWKAATWLMQNSPDTRGQFGQQPKDNKLEVVINIDRKDGVTIKGEVVE